MRGEQQDLRLCNFFSGSQPATTCLPVLPVCVLYTSATSVCVPVCSLQAALCRTCQLLRACLAATESVRSIKTKLTARRHRSRRLLISRELSLVLRWCLDCCHYTSRCCLVCCYQCTLILLSIFECLPAALPLHQLLLPCLSARHSMQLLIQCTVLPGGTSSS